MNKTDTDTHRHKVRISVYAVLTMVLSSTACVSLLCYLLLVRNRIIKCDNSILINICGLMPYLSIIALMLGVLGLIRVYRSHGQLKGYAYASLGIVLALFSFHLLTRCLETVRQESNIARKQERQPDEFNWKVEENSSKSEQKTVGNKVR